MIDWLLIGLWICMALQVLGIPMHLYDVAQGTIKRERTPFDSAVMALMDVGFLMFFWLIIQRVVG